MEVIIDGIKYQPAPEVCADAGPLEVRLYVDDLDQEVSLREYFCAMLTKLWAEGEGFSGKRPFGNSGWEYDVYRFLVASGAVAGTLDEEGNVEQFDRDAANELTFGLIGAAFGLTGASK